MLAIEVIVNGVLLPVVVVEPATEGVVDVATEDLGVNKEPEEVEINDEVEERYVNGRLE